MEASRNSSSADLPTWAIVVIGVGSSVIGLFLGGVVEILGEPRDLTGGAVVLGVTVVTLFALSEIDMLMKDDPWLRVMRVSAAIITAWVAVGAAIAKGLPPGWGIGAGVLIAAYLARRVYAGETDLSAR